MRYAKFSNLSTQQVMSVTAKNSAAMGFLSKLVCSGLYTDEQAFNACLQYDNDTHNLWIMIVPADLAGLLS